MGLIGDAFAARAGQPVRLVASGSGSLRRRIEQGERPDLFASADLGHPQALAAQGLARTPAIFARNTQCLLARKGLELPPTQVVDRLLDPRVRVGISTPGLDPGGDYAWQLFERIGTLRAGSTERLKA
ncbi:MAG TPA: substrate-binding domain-containing protein, partial [Holophaga sp.]|nr:substrate-binding domain-containing protein [Holophaga sp.]